MTTPSALASKAAEFREEFSAEMTRTKGLLNRIFYRGRLTPAKIKPFLSHLRKEWKRDGKLGPSTVYTDGDFNVVYHKGKFTLFPVRKKKPKLKPV